ncbi:MAG: hypothetical protein SGI89_10440, partial [bacterium]|nr:hypothetical protein [bacterium]
SRTRLQGNLLCHHEIDMQAVGNDKTGGNSPAGKLLCHHEIDMQAVGNDKAGGNSPPRRLLLSV